MNLLGRILKTTTSDGLELNAVLFEPQKKSSTLVIHFPGKEGDFLQNHFIEQMAVDYSHAGYAFMTASHRGKSYMADILRKSATGYEYTQLGTAFDIFEDCVYDIEAWIKNALELGYTKIVLQQHSTPHKIVWYTHKTKSKNIVGLILISPADFRFLFEKYVTNYQANLGLAKQLVARGKAKQLMPVTLWSNCPVSAGTFYNWGNLQSPFLEFDYADPARGFAYFPQVKLPMLAILSENDFSVGEPAQKCLDTLKEKSNSVSFTSHLVKKAPHSYLGWEQELTTTIIHWLQNTIGK